VAVLSRREGEEQVVEQLLPGEVFGEIAMLSGEPRTASVRTVARTTLVKVKREALLTLMSHNARLEETILAAFAQRRFDTIAGNSTRFGCVTSSIKM
jgi:CRP-like cAMP-binding protein